MTYIRKTIEDHAALGDADDTEEGPGTVRDSVASPATAAPAYILRHRSSTGLHTSILESGSCNYYIAIKGALLT